MKPLLDLENRHPFASSMIGATSGVTSWLFANSTEITQIAGMIGAICTAIIALLAVASKFYAATIIIRQKFRKRPKP